ncbi:hypothetical protein [Pseudomonas sp. GD03944]|uniref:hypothetical protein n=1 Tax=Pseudomonas sp. GD03944 TaxID=2975409 RepID=UPI0024472C39|nr:hypothetical protein [Pseudomonas sp. GD03944]MDH1263417.1 hypothetical protein [Pseudomonas sp. GD03944]
MKLHSVLTAVLVVSSLSFAQVSLAEESPAFVAHKAALAQRAADVAEQHAQAEKAAPGVKQHAALQQADEAKDS